MALKVKRTGVMLRPDETRVFFRPFDFMGSERLTRIVARVMGMPDREVDREYQKVIRNFVDRHMHLPRFFLRQFEEVECRLFTDAPVSDTRKLLLGAYFSQEYSLEAAALFNPSIVPHPDQSDLPPGSLRCVLSLRATGEGHLSSIVFRTVTIDADTSIKVMEPTKFVTAPTVRLDAKYEKRLFERKLVELGLLDHFAIGILDEMPETFELARLSESVERHLKRDRTLSQEKQMVANGMLSVARSNYEIEFSPEQRISERVIFPNTPAERRGIEDARFVLFTEDDGTTCYYATYTAFDGQVTLPQLLETKDFLNFKVSTLNGPEVQNKGMALFPKRVGGRYAMVGRQDGENLYLMFSDSIHFWHTRQILMRPTYPWEFVQIGNCGSPIETDAGWLVLTHGVGAMRQYAIGAILLDRHDPSLVLGRLREPLLRPSESEREGYVPNVVYSCGGLVHGEHLILPYAVSDQCSTFATVLISDLIAELLGSDNRRRS